MLLTEYRAIIRKAMRYGDSYLFFGEVYVSQQAPRMDGSRDMEAMMYEFPFIVAYVDDELCEAYQLPHVVIEDGEPVRYEGGDIPLCAPCMRSINLAMGKHMNSAQAIADMEKLSDRPIYNT